MPTSFKNSFCIYRPNQRWIQLCLAGLVFLSLAVGILLKGTTVLSQEPQDSNPFARTVDQIPQLGGNIILLNDLDVVVNDVKSLLNDIGAPELVFFASNLFKMESSKGFDPKAGVFQVFGIDEASWRVVLVAYGIVDKGF